MVRKSILVVMREILFILKKENELSIKAVSDKISSQWETTVKALEFLKELGILKERAGKESYKVERLFSLKK